MGLKAPAQRGRTLLSTVVPRWTRMQWHFDGEEHHGGLLGLLQSPDQLRVTYGAHGNVERHAGEIGHMDVVKSNTGADGYPAGPVDDAEVRPGVGRYPRPIAEDIAFAAVSGKVAGL